MKHFKEFGVAQSGNIVNEAHRANVPVDRVARGYTYTTRDDGFPPTNLAMPENPFVVEVLGAQNILDVGCGVGRNLPWIMEHTHARYHGLDPNPVMLENFWKVTDPKYKDPRRVELYDDIDLLPPGLQMDVVVVTFVFQHLGFRAPPDVMNVTDITRRIRDHTRRGTVWILLEHELEELWIRRWTTENNIKPDVFIPYYKGLPELLHRGDQSHLIIWKEPT